MPGYLGYPAFWKEGNLGPIVINISICLPSLAGRMSSPKCKLICGVDFSINSLVNLKKELRSKLSMPPVL